MSLDAIEVVDLNSESDSDDGSSQQSAQVNRRGKSKRDNARESHAPRHKRSHVEVVDNAHPRKRKLDSQKSSHGTNASGSNDNKRWCPDADDIEVIDETSPPPHRVHTTAPAEKGEEKEDIIDLVDSNVPSPVTTAATAKKVISYSDFANARDFDALTSRVVRHSEITNQDDAYERSRLEDLAKKHRKRQEEREQNQMLMRRVLAQSFLEHYATQCRKRVKEVSPDAFEPPLDVGGDRRRPAGAVTFKFRFADGSTHQLVLPPSAPLSVLFDFCDAVMLRKSLDAAATPANADGSSSNANPKSILDGDIESVLKQHAEDATEFTKLPQRLKYSLQHGRRSWINRPREGSGSTLTSMNLSGRLLLTVGNPPPSFEEKSAAEWKQKFSALQNYVKTHGHCNVPPSDHELGMW